MKLSLGWGGCDSDKFLRVFFLQIRTYPVVFKLLLRVETHIWESVRQRKKEKERKRERNRNRKIQLKLMIPFFFKKKDTVKKRIPWQKKKPGNRTGVTLVPGLVSLDCILKLLLRHWRTPKPPQSGQGDRLERVHCKVGITVTRDFKNGLSLRLSLLFPSLFFCLVVCSE